MLKTQTGFTLLEMLVVMVIGGIVAAIAAPSFLGVVESNRLTVGRDTLYLGLREAQIAAQRQNTIWQFSLRERDSLLEWATHPKSLSPQLAQWQSLDFRSVRIDGETTFATAGNVYYVRFDEDGNVQYRLGRITLSSEKNPNIKRCVIVSTIIGAMRKSKEQPTAQNGKRCY